jgi:translation initiation factor IF-3
MPDGGSPEAGSLYEMWPLARVCAGLETRRTAQAAAAVFLWLEVSGRKWPPPKGCRISQAKRVRRNEEIATSSVRVIGAEGEQIGILKIDEALATASGQGLDLVEVAPNSDPPVCRIMDYGKFVFEQNKKAQSARRKQKQIHVKEVKFRPGTEEGDYQVKLRNLIRFLTSGDKTKVTLRFRGREMAHQELGLELLKRVQADLQEYGTVEQYPQLEGRQMVMVISPRKH